jgi:transposase
LPFLPFLGTGASFLAKSEFHFFWPFRGLVNGVNLTYMREFKLEAVHLLETSGRNATQLERELGIGGGCLYRWRRKFAEEGENAFPGHGRLAPDQEHIHQLEQENEILRQERDILKKAVAIFSHPSR